MVDTPSLLRDQVAVVTGASGDLGRAIALRMGASGARVVLHYRSRRAAAEEAAAAIRELGSEAELFQGDLVDGDAITRLMACAAERWQRLDILVNNAGGSRDGLLLMQSESDLRAVLEANLTSAMLCSREALRYMLRKHRGAIINISSLSALTGLPGQTAYSAAKAGLVGLTRALAREVGGKGIRVNAVAPGLIDSAVVRALPEPMRDLRNIALGRLGKPDEVATAVLFLASELSSYMTGAVLNLSGGLHTGSS
jgi:3-oxoacyl-[acyl-carrier protein] reductase